MMSRVRQLTLVRTKNKKDDRMRWKYSMELHDENPFFLVACH